jgi:hypothetical protein
MSGYFTATLPPPATSTSSPADLMRSVLADIRSEVFNTKASLITIGKALQSGNKSLSVRTMMEEEQVFNANSNEVATRLRDAAAIAESDVKVHRELDGRLVAIENDWERTRLLWPSAPATEQALAAFDLEDATRKTAQATDHLSHLLLQIAMFTVPGDVDRWIRTQELGRPFKFHERFEDEIPLKEDRDRILGFLAASPGSFPAIIDPDTGEIYRTSGIALRLLASYGILLAVVIGGGVLLNILTTVWPDAVGRQTSQAVMQAYIAVLGGALFHFVTTLAKNRKALGEGGAWSPRQLALWGLLHEKSIWVGVGLLWLGPLGMASVLKSTDLATAFFVGYSFDSFLDLFLTRFSDVVALQSSGLAKAFAAAK